MKQPPNCQNVSSFLFFFKLSVLVESSPASCNIRLGPLHYTKLASSVVSCREGLRRQRGGETPTKSEKPSHRARHHGSARHRRHRPVERRARYRD
ncbi:hypothetical protein N658DRAFT_170482 [Parathielavia hyrcaniae]|uniref:Secreted protein n=1 Tax=Parathielavia hyrcaniae TaxID=113614 RepID=A0AAN6PY10_9PEZI|nr:hypothetical protein N658DRAFT_170482 [Parathielavia hyrcaniae]